MKIMNKYFDIHKWNYKKATSAKEILFILKEYGVIGKKIKKISSIGIAKNLEKWRYEGVVNNALENAGVPWYENDEKEKYPYLANVSIPCCARLCEPFILVFDDNTTLELMPKDGDMLLIGYNSISAELTDGVNERNYDPDLMFDALHACKIADVSIQTRIITNQHGRNDIQEERGNKIFQFILNGDYGFMIRQSWDGWFDVYMTNQKDSDELGNKAATITYGKLKDAVYNNDQIVIVSGHDSSSYFWIMPVKVNSEAEDYYEKVDEYRDEEISIEESDVSNYLSYFLYKYMDDDISYEGVREESTGGFEWYLEHNFFRRETIEEMLLEIEKASILLSEDPDNEMLPRIFSEYERIKEDINKVCSFYDRFIFRMKTMLDNWPEGYEYVSFMGP